MVEQSKTDQDQAMSAAEATRLIREKEMRLRQQEGQQEQQEERKNRDFYMIFDRNGTSALQEVAQKSGRAVVVFLWLAEHMDHQGAVCVSNEMLGAELGMEGSNVSRALSLLRERGVIYTLRRGMLVHCINPDICWRSTETGKRYALFHAAVIADEEELTQARDEAQRRAAAARDRQQNRMRKARAFIAAPTRQRTFEPPVGPEPAVEAKLEPAGKVELKKKGPGLKINRPARPKK